MSKSRRGIIGVRETRSRTRLLTFPELSIAWKPAGASGELRPMFGRGSNGQTRSTAMVQFGRGSPQSRIVHIGSYRFIDVQRFTGGCDFAGKLFWGKGLGAGIAWIGPICVRRGS